MEIEIKIDNDYEGYFENYVKNNIAPYITSKSVKEITVSAQPYLGSACEIRKIKEGSILLLFYSPLRTGFGSLNPKDVVEYINKTFN